MIGTTGLILKAMVEPFASAELAEAVPVVSGFWVVPVTLIVGVRKPA